jgi:hypothetical protein
MDLPAIAAAATPATTTSTSTSTASSTPAPTTEAGKPFATLLAEAKKDLHSGERLTRVKGHQFARIKGGERDDQCVNLSGNARNGEVFDLIWRDGRCFHVYGGKGAGHVVVEVGTSEKDSTAAKQAASTSGGTAAA